MLDEVQDRQGYEEDDEDVYYPQPPTIGDEDHEQELYNKNQFGHFQVPINHRNDFMLVGSSAGNTNS
jgi:hypothetical protein